MSLTPDELDDLRLEVESVIKNDIAPIFTNVYRFTLVARHRGRADATVIVTNDNPESVIEAIRREIERLEPVSDLDARRNS